MSNLARGGAVIAVAVTAWSGGVTAGCAVSTGVTREDTVAVLAASLERSVGIEGTIYLPDDTHPLVVEAAGLVPGLRVEFTEGAASFCDASDAVEGDKVGETVFLSLSAGDRSRREAFYMDADVAYVSVGLSCLTVRSGGGVTTTLPDGRFRSSSVSSATLVLRRRWRGWVVTDAINVLMS